ncbi:helix-turn-helix transcriptional regulator [Actinoallomurus sp. NPDC052274]|uniref:helix-turn-helix domain-containing protein n=1 Tax=Actinoallomurus sp. NPDC052274 TaxID=3155420 RepID=UPI00341C5B37
MSQADDLDPFRSVREWMACELRERRKVAGMTQLELAQFLRVTKPQIQHLEAGRRAFHKDHAEALDELWPTGQLFLKLYTHQHREHDREWFRRYTGYECRADDIRIFQPLVIPGLFQTPAYTRALLESSRAPDLDEAVSARTARQEILDRDDPPEVWAIIMESVLRNPIGGPAVLREQLARLLEIAHCPNVTVQVIPTRAGAHVGLDGGFVLLSVDDERIAFVEAQLSGRLVRDEGESKELAVRYNRIRAKALSEDDSLTLIASILEDLSHAASD